MKEIKFRLRNGNKIVGYCEWLIIEGEFGRWVYSPDNELWNVGYPEILHKEKDTFTGLKDKNGKEIYEGDIVRTSKHMTPTEYYSPETVKWDDNALRWNGLYPLLMPWSQHEIIGNIYENPELIKTKRKKRK